MDQQLDNKGSVTATVPNVWIYESSSSDWGEW